MSRHRRSTYQEPIPFYGLMVGALIFIIVCLAVIGGLLGMAVAARG